MSIVTVSHEIGAGGPEIGQKVAERLGLHYVDQELISDAALRYGVLEEKLSSLDESKPSLFERFDAETRRYITVLQTALFEFAEKDRVGLMGRAGRGLLPGMAAGVGRGGAAGPARPVAPAGHPACGEAGGDGAVRPAGQAPRQEALRADGRADQS